MKQVNKAAYAFDAYLGIDRWASYYYQIREILACKPATVLEIGVGDRAVGDYLKRHGIAYIAADVADDLSPDVVADITALPFADNAFDVVCAFEVLEHLPFHKFEVAVRELTRVAKRYVLISLPHFGPSVRFEVKLPLISRIRIAIKVPFPKKHEFNGEHFWEIGKRGYPASRIRTLLTQVGQVDKEFIPFENQYHHFFRIAKT